MHLFAGVAVTDYDAALAWYGRLMGAPPDMHPHEKEAVWKVGDASWIYVVADSTRAGAALLTLIVDDLDEHVVALAARGLRTTPIETVGGVVRKAEIIDSEGNRITFGEPMAP